MKTARKYFDLLVPVAFADGFCWPGTNPTTTTLDPVHWTPKLDRRYGVRIDCRGLVGPLCSALVGWPVREQHCVMSRTARLFEHPPHYRGCRYGVPQRTFHQMAKHHLT